MSAAVLRRAAGLTGLMTLASGAAAAPRAMVPDPQFSRAQRALFDRPLSTARVAVPPLDPGGPAGAVRCFRYGTFFVKEVDYGEHGDDHIAVAPIAKRAPAPACQLRVGKREVALPSSAESYFLGAKGRFGFVQSTTGQDGTLFAIHDLARGAILHADQMALGSVPAGLVLADGTLSIDYVRSVSGSCSIPAGGAACWARIATEAGLPPAIAAALPPLALCRAGYAAARAARGEASVLNYRVSLTIDATGRRQLRSGAITACRPRN
jgi:hypothetical protein